MSVECEREEMASHVSLIFLSGCEDRLVWGKEAESTPNPRSQEATQAHASLHYENYACLCVGVCVFLLS